MKTFLFFILLVGFSPFLFAKQYYVDPINGREDGNGSQKRPWKSLNWMLENNLIEYYSWDNLPYTKNKSVLRRVTSSIVKGGDTLLLLQGDYGAFKVKNFYFKKPLIIRSAQKKIANFHSIEVMAGSNLLFDGITIQPDPNMKKPKKLFSVISHNWLGPVQNISLINSSLSSFQKLSKFNKQVWQKRVIDGIYSDASHSKYANNILTNTGFSMTFSGNHVRVENNLINFFSGDGIRALGDYGIYEGNTIKNSIDLKNGNHDDAFQSWSRNGQPVKGVVIRNNKVINYENPEQPLRGPLQGIGLFDGFFEDWTIENNIIAIDQWHGITISGFKNCKIINNTIVDLNFKRPGPPWIMLSNHKDGRVSNGCIVRNNLTPSLKLRSGKNIISDHNYVTKSPHPMFINFFNHDFRLKPNAAVIDAGSALDAPKTDRLGNLRGPGNLYDIGAYEYIEGK